MVFCIKNDRWYAIIFVCSLIKFLVAVIALGVGLGLAKAEFTPPALSVNGRADILHLDVRAVNRAGEECWRGWVSTTDEWFA